MTYSAESDSAIHYIYELINTKTVNLKLGHAVLCNCINNVKAWDIEIDFPPQTVTPLLREGWERKRVLGLLARLSFLVFFVHLHFVHS